MTPCRFLSSSNPTISWIWVSNPTSGESSDARSARPVRVGAYTSWPAASKKGMTFCQHQPPCHPPCTSTNVAMLASFFTDWTLTKVENRKKRHYLTRIPQDNGVDQLFHHWLQGLFQQQQGQEATGEQLDRDQWLMRSEFAGPLVPYLHPLFE